MSLSKMTSTSTSAQVIIDADYLDTYNKEHETDFELYPVHLVSFKNDGKLIVDAQTKSAQTDITIQAEKDTELWVIPAEIYKQVMDESAPLSNFTGEVMAARFSDVMWLIEQILWKSFDKRLAAFLLEEAAIEGTHTLRITHELIGNHMGNPREVVTRMLRYFQSEGMVKLSRGTVEIVNESRLRRLTE